MCICVFVPVYLEKTNVISCFTGRTVSNYVLLVYRILSDDLTLESSARFDTFGIVKKTYEIMFDCIGFVKIRDILRVCVCLCKIVERKMV